jgi:uncharacterized protein (UPF0332 family)
MKDKARASLRACQHLLEAGFFDPAASRLYYALFQAALQGLANAGVSPGDVSSGETRWNHALIAQNTYRCRKQKGDRGIFESLRSLREQADYQPEPIERADVDQWLADVEGFVTAVAV